MRYWDPDGAEFGIPTYPKRLAPEGYATRRQLRAKELRPGGQPVAAQILWLGRRPPGERERLVRVAYLYRIDLALPVRPMTPGRWRSVHAMLRARRTCRDCAHTYDYVLPTSLGRCCPGCAGYPVALAA